MIKYIYKCSSCYNICNLASEKQQSECCECDFELIGRYALERDEPQQLLEDEINGLRDNWRGTAHCHIELDRILTKFEALVLKKRRASDD